MRAKTLHRERGLRLGAVPREALADQAQVERGDLAVEHPAQQPVLAERLDERPVDTAVVLRQRCEDVTRQPLRMLEQFDVLWGEVRVGRAQAITAVATSSTFASTSNSALTPSSAIAGYRGPKCRFQTGPRSRSAALYSATSVTNSSI
jgi:hypothetical protein